MQPLLFNNGWTAVDGTSNNWRVGIVTHSPTLGGAKAAYVSTNTGTNNAYSSPTAITSHFYRDIVVPAGATFITLSFEWRGNIETNFDRFLVYTAPATVTPVAGGAGVGIPASGSNVLPGATLIFTQTTNSGTGSSTTTYVAQSFVLANTLAGTTVRLIFTWQNNASGAFQPPAAIDNVSLTYIPPIPPTITSFTPTTVCAGTTPTITITGTDFPGATAVKFNGVNATSFTVVNATTITAVLPAAGVTTGLVSVTTPNGTATSATNLTINPPSPASLTYTSNSPVYCVGTAITNNTPSNGGGPVTAYSVSPALPAGLSLDAGTGIISGTPTAATASATYTVTASNSCGSTTKDLTILVTTTPLSIIL